MAEPVVLHRLKSANTQRELEYAAYFVESIRAAYVEAGAYDLASAFTERIGEAIGDSSFAMSADEIQARYEAELQAAGADTLLP